MAGGTKPSRRTRRAERFKAGAKTSGGIGSRPRLNAEDGNKNPLVDREYAGERVGSVADAIREAGRWLRELHKFDLVAVGDRVVHGGPEYSQPVLQLA